MLRLAPRLFRPVFVAFFGCISLLGQGLHVLVEHPLHEDAATPCACSSALSQCSDRGHTHRGCGHWHAEPVARTSAPFASTGKQPPPELVAKTAHDPHQCPICCFFAQAQWAVDFEPELHAAPMAPFAQQAECLRPVTAVGVYQSRAPPNGRCHLLATRRDAQLVDC